MSTQGRPRAREYALDYLIEWGPATIAAIAERGGLAEPAVRMALLRLEQAGDVVRAGTVVPQHVHRGTGGGRATLWAIAGDVEETP